MKKSTYNLQAHCQSRRKHIAKAAESQRCDQSFVKELAKPTR